MTAAEYKATRKPLGTQTQVAAMLGVNRVTVAKRENGTMTITNEAALAIQSLVSKDSHHYEQPIISLELQ